MKEGRKKLALHQPLMTGVSYMIPIICMGGLLQALGTMIGGAGVATAEGTLAYYLFKGGSLTMGLVVPVLSAYISFAVADRPGLAPGFLMGLLSLEYKIGFIGGILGGYLVGYFCLLLKKMKFPKTLKSLMPMLIIPLLGGLFSVLTMNYILGPPLMGLTTVLTRAFANMGIERKVLFGVVLGILMGIDLGGPITKIGTTIPNGLVADGIIGPEGAKVCIGVVSALALGLSSTFFSKKKYTDQERVAGKSAIILGSCQLAEGGLPFLLNDPVRVIPASVVGCALTGGLAMYFDVGSPVLMGGLFALPVMQNAFPGAIIAIAAGTTVTVILLHLLKPNIDKKEQQAAGNKTNTELDIVIENL